MGHEAGLLEAPARTAAFPRGLPHRAATGPRGRQVVIRSGMIFWVRITIRDDYVTQEVGRGTPSEAPCGVHPPGSPQRQVEWGLASLGFAPGAFCVGWLCPPRF